MKTKSSTSSYVYFIYDGEFVKIGKSDETKNRLKQLQTGSSARLVLLDKIETDKPFELEKSLHTKFKDKHHINEWFSLEIDDLHEIGCMIGCTKFPQILYTEVSLGNSSTEYRAPDEHKRKIIKDINVTAAYLYDYYVSICQIPSWDLTDDYMVAKQIGLSKRKVADTRCKLTSLGWIRFDTHKHNGVKYGLWYIGKEVVSAKMNQETALEEYGKIVSGLDIATIKDEELE